MFFLTTKTFKEISIHYADTYLPDLFIFIDFKSMTQHRTYEPPTIEPLVLFMSSNIRKAESAQGF